MDLTLKVWRQDGPGKPGEFREYEAKDISPDSSFLEMLDVVNERLVEQGEVPIEFDHDCCEGICGTCGVMINGHPHGDQKGTATCQLHMRKFKDGDRIVIEPWRASNMPVIRDLIVDRSALDRIIEAGGYISVATGGTPDANLIPIPKSVAPLALPPVRTVPGSCSQRQNWRISTSCPRGNRSATSAPSPWWRKWRSSSVRAPTTGSARRRVRRASASTTSL